jgi:hypothetical protein
MIVRHTQGVSTERKVEKEEGCGRGRTASVDVKIEEDCAIDATKQL